MWKRFWRSENRLANVTASLLLAAAFGLMGLLDDPVPVGADPIERKTAAAFTLPILPSMASASLAQMPIAEPIRVAAAVDLPVPGGLGVAAPGTLVPVPEPDAKTLTGKWGLQMNVMILQRGIEKFAAAPYYKCKFFKQEVVGGSLLEGQDIDLKMGHAPFSVYMKWRSGDKGRQVIYVDGQNENCLLCQPGGIAGRLSGTLRMAINSDLVMAENRHPITQVGIVGLARKIIDAQVRNLQESIPTFCQFTEDATFEDRPCFRCVCEYVNPAHSEIYRKSEMLVDREMSLPVMVKNFGWGEKGKPLTDENSLIEHYSYSEIEVSDAMSPTDFDPKNKKYYMRLK